MLVTGAALALSLASSSYAQETVLGVYMFHRHGDRTAKITPPVNLTALGYQEVYTSGDYFRSRYVSSNAPLKINGISSDIVKQSQIAASSSYDAVLQPSTMGFFQALYPGLGSPSDVNTLRNGTTITPPLNGYQFIPINTVSTGTNSENTAWLQSTSTCYNALVSSNDYFYSSQYTTLLNSTQSFYQNLLPVINGSYNTNTSTYKNAYGIYDLINVANIHNATINSSSLLTTDTVQQLRTLADTHEYNLAYNSSSLIRSIAGMTLAAQIVTFLNTTITSSGANKLGVQFGAYASFQSLFGLANLTAADPMFYGIPDYASVMVFELFTTSNFSGKFPASTTDLQVRFLWHNGTTSNISEPTVYPLFGQSNTSLSWDTFQSSMNKFAIYGQADWCTACGNTTGTCSAEALGTSTSSSSSSTTSSSTSASSTASTATGASHMSNAVAGVIGAAVTLGAVLLITAAVMLLGGLTLASKKKLGNGANGQVMSKTSAAL